MPCKPVERKFPIFPAQRAEVTAEVQNRGNCDSATEAKPPFAPTQVFVLNRSPQPVRLA